MSTTIDSRTPAGHGCMPRVVARLLLVEQLRRPRRRAQRFDAARIARGDREGLGAGVPAGREVERLDRRRRGVLDTCGRAVDRDPRLRVAAADAGEVVVGRRRRTRAGRSRTARAGRRRSTCSPPALPSRQTAASLSSQASRTCLEGRRRGHLPRRADPAERALDVETVQLQPRGRGDRPRRARASEREAAGRHAREDAAQQLRAALRALDRRSRSSAGCHCSA